MNIKSRVLTMFVVWSCISVCSAQSPQDVIDTPTTQLYAPQEYGFNIFMYDEGEMITEFTFGMIRGLNVGLSMDFYKAISKENMKTRPPKLNTKISVYSGGKYFPAMAFGYEGQGYGQYVNGNYLQREKGLYFVFGRELFIQDWEWDAGVNMYDFENTELYGFINTSYLFAHHCSVLLEYDNIHRTPQNRWNIGFRYELNKYLNMSISVKRINDVDNGFERTFSISYRGKLNMR